MIGKVSWFGGPNDPTDSGHTASGGTTKEPGIAVYNHGTLGGYWRVTAANGKTAVLRQTDIGPAPWTGRKVDITYSALNKFGYSEKNFPTDSTVKAEYLGKNLPKGVAMGSASPGGVTREGALQRFFTPNPAETIPTFNKQGFEEARQHAQRERATAGLFKGTEPGENLLREVLNRAGKVPNAQEFGGTRVVKAPGGTFTYAANSGPANSLANAVPHGAKLNGFLAGNEPLEVKRKDQGQDIKTSPNGAIYAPGDGVVKMVNSNPGGFGNAYPIVHFNTGPLAGHDVYIGHTRAALPAGAHFKAGSVLSHTGNGSGPFVGNATGLPGWAEIGLWTPSGPPAFGKGGNEIAPLLGLR